MGVRPVIRPGAQSNDWAIPFTRSIMPNFNQNINSPTTKRIISIIVFSFLTTFIIARAFVYLVLNHWMPNFFLTVNGVHIHHFTYGVVILTMVGLYLILKRPSTDSRTFLWSVLLYGIGLGLTFDEFGMWIHLKDDYWIRHSYDAVIIVVLFLLNIAYYKSLWQILTLKRLRENLKNNHL